MHRTPALLAATLLWLGVACHGALTWRRGPPMGPYRAAGSHQAASNSIAGRELIKQCKVYFRNRTLDHFSWAAPPENRTTFQQRYFLCDKHWKGNGAPIFFYVGNEADVTLYLNATGIMWESAPGFGALLVFAEHRYYGLSKPYKGKALRRHMQFLTSEQAMADYAVLIGELKAELHAHDSAVIGFGGSYGGMLGTWMRLKYPHVLDGMVAGSAPIWSYLGEEPTYDSGSYAKIVTRDASEEGGSAPACAANVRKAWATLFGWGEDNSGRSRIAAAMRVCSALNTSDDVAALADWASSAWDYMAMGNYPYPSSYILNGNGELPAYPVRVACEYLAEEGLEGTPLLTAFADSLGVFYNYSQALECFDFAAGANPETDEDGAFWDYQWCTEQFQPFSKDGEHDMYWPQPFSVAESVERCRQQWAVTPRPMWATVEWGGRRIESASNIVFTNGLLDPWHGGGVLRNISDSLTAIVIPEGAHHLDFMFSNELDPPSVLAARTSQRALMRQWIAEAGARRRAVRAATPLLS